MSHKIPHMPTVYQHQSGVSGERLSILTEISIANDIRVTVLDRDHGDSIVGNLSYSEAQALMWSLKDTLRMMRAAS